MQVSACLQEELLAMQRPGGSDLVGRQPPPIERRNDRLPIWLTRSSSPTPPPNCGRCRGAAGTLGGRDPLDQWAGRRDDATLAAYQAQRNTTSIDDLPALPMAPGDQQTGSG
jgi:hypothetical protein